MSDKISIEFTAPEWDLIFNIVATGRFQDVEGIIINARQQFLKAKADAALNPPTPEADGEAKAEG